MADKRMQSAPIQAMRPKRRVITSCLECYRRKQKCDRVRPCSFCSARGVPELCHYDEAFRQHSTKIISAPNQEHVRASSTSDGESYASTMAGSLPSFIDQVGYSTTSRRDQLQCLGEDVPSAATSDAARGQLVGISNTNAYLSFVARMPCEKTTDELIRIHFSAENWSFPILDEHHFHDLHTQFRGHLSEDFPPKTVRHLPPRLSTFPALLFSVLASALQFIDPETDIAYALGIDTVQDCDRLSQSYIDTGQKIIELLKQQKPTTTSIEYHLKKTAWLKNCGRGNESWQCLGTALRQAQEIDLHQIQEDGTHTSGVSVERTLLHLWELEHRKRLWARIFIIDSHMAVALGRPRGIHREDCSTPTPLDCDYPSNPLQTVPVSTNHTCMPPNPFSPVMFSIALGHKYHDMMSLRSSKLDLKDYSRVQVLHNEIQSLLSELPPALRPSFPDTTWDGQNPLLSGIRLRLLTMANIFLLALHRPYVSTHVASRYAAIRAAFTMLQAQQELFLIVPQAQHRLYGYSFYTIDAGIFLAAIVVKYPTFDPEIPTRVLQELQQASSRLGRIKDRSKIARTGELVLRRCCAIIEPITPSPSSIASYDGIKGQEQLMGLDNMSFLREFGTHIPDQATHELISFLADPSTSINPSSSTTLPINGEDFPDTDFPPFNSAPVTNVGYSDLAMFDQSHWRF